MGHGQTRNQNYYNFDIKYLTQPTKKENKYLN